MSSYVTIGDRWIICNAGTCTLCFHQWIEYPYSYILWNLDDWLCKKYNEIWHIEFTKLFYYLDNYEGDMISRTKTSLYNLYSSVKFPHWFQNSQLLVNHRFYFFRGLMLTKFPYHLSLQMKTCFNVYCTLRLLM